MFDEDVEVVGGKGVGEFAGPFHDDDAAGGEELIEADGLDVGGREEAVGVEVIDGFGALIDVQEDIGWGRDEGGVIDGSAFGDATGEVSFAGAQLAIEGDEGVRRREAAEELAKREGFGDGVGGEEHGAMIRGDKLATNEHG